MVPTGRGRTRIDQEIRVVRDERPVPSLGIQQRLQLGGLLRRQYYLLRQHFDLRVGANKEIKPRI